MNKKLLVIILFFATGCSSVKQAERYINKNEINYYNDQKQTIVKWQNKWDKSFSPELKMEFEKQAKSLITNQKTVLEGYIKNGKEKAAKKQADYILKTYKYAGDKSLSMAISSSEKEYLERAENLAKISYAEKMSNQLRYKEWQNKWAELAAGIPTNEYLRQPFVNQANKLFAYQLKKIKNHIERGEEQDCIYENEALKDNYKFVREKYENYESEKTEKALTDEYLSRVPTLVKMKSAFLLMNNNQSGNWQKKWLEIAPNAIIDEYVRIEFVRQSKILLQKQIDLLQNYITIASEKQTKSIRNSLQSNYDFVRQIYQDFETENDIVNLNDDFLSKSVNLSKISAAKIFIENQKFKEWAEKWTEIGYDISEKYLIDAFENQSVVVFSKLYSDLSYAKNSKNCASWEEKSNLMVLVLLEALKIYPNFDNFCNTNQNLQNIKLDELMNSNRNSKICIAEEELNKKNYNKWIAKWAEIESIKFLDGYEIKIFNQQCENGFGALLNDIENSIEKGDFDKTKQQADLALDLSTQKVLAVNPNYVPLLQDLNKIYLYNAKFFAKANNIFLQGKYKKSIEYLLQNCDKNLQKKELQPKFTAFFTKNLKKLVEIYQKTISKDDDDLKVADLNRMNDIYKLKPNYISITYRPDFLNNSKQVFVVWLNKQLGQTIEDFFNEADDLISKNLYTLAYDFIFNRANKLPKDQNFQNRINSYSSTFETKGTDYYKSKINKKILENQYLIANNILENDLLKINSDFQTDRKNEYQQIVTNIQTKGTNYYINERNKMIANEKWDEYCHNYCDSIHFINPTYNTSRCHDEIDFEKDFFYAESEFENGKYFCAIEIAKTLKKYNVDAKNKTRIDDLIYDCKQDAILTVNYNVENDDLNEDLDTYLLNQLQNYKRNYSYRDYFEIRNNGRGDYLADLTISDFSYDSGWRTSSTHYACLVFYRDVEHVKIVKKQKKIVEVIDGVNYFKAKDYYGKTIFVREINGYIYCLNDEKEEKQYPYQFEYLYNTVEEKQPYTVRQYKYKKVPFEEKTGIEEMSFYAQNELKENMTGYLKFTDGKTFSESVTYKKYQIPSDYDYDITKLVKCPNVRYDVWLDEEVKCKDFDESPFNNPSDPFEGRNKFYNYYLKKDLKNYIKDNVPQMLERVHWQHNKMNCD